MKRLMISLAISAPLFLSSTSSFSTLSSGSVAYDRLDSTTYVQPLGNYSNNAVKGTQVAYWRHGWHRGYRWHRWHRGYGWHRWHRRYW